MKNQFIIIDDEALHNTICEINIKKVNPGAQIQSFTYPPNGIEHLRHLMKKKNPNFTLFLDLEMPVMDGMEVLEELYTFIPPDNPDISIYVLSSYVDLQNREHAKAHPLVVDFIEKPLTTDVIYELLTARDLESEAQA